MQVLSRSVTVLLVTAAAGVSHDARACDALGADWASVGPTSAGGDLGGNGVSATGFISQPILATGDLSGPEYGGAPLSSSEEMLIYGYASRWTVTFDSPVQDLLVYARSWRGITGTGIDVEYTFDRPFTILSGFPSAAINGNTLILPNGSFEDGILLFSGSVSSVGVIDVNSTGGFSQQSLTFGRLPVPCATDLDGDCIVGVTELLDVLGAWGRCAVCAEDLTGDGAVNVLDLMEVLAAWGPC